MKLVIAGGGTGGHLFPGIALAGEFTRSRSNVEVVFMGAERGLETKVVPALGYTLVTLPVRGVVGYGFIAGIARAVALVAAAARAFWILGRLRPDLVIGVGGYASVPAVLAAAMRGLPRSILEQNVSPGRANQVLARFAQRIYQGFASPNEKFPLEKTMITGNPIRPEVLPEPGLTRPPGRKTLLVLGGSQGAQQINNLVLDVVPRLKQDFPDLAVIHQTGNAHEESVREAYRRMGVADVEVVPFITGMADAYARADLCLSRAGAMAVSELTASGLPAVLIPYPHAAGGHQGLNARWMEERGAAVVIQPGDATADLLFKQLERLFGAPGLLADMATASFRAGIRNAAERIVEEELKRLGTQGHGDAETR
ncbi:MAG: undecaprenyldiphospho-muramoylpentapeptide beta-N-acetylglucosaminyltransferase [bacterium]|nr:MAG: undecaprenyldiphospho-muramoylpentapeptide beta-N-acetylglucosaminyltransferase [bacterium]